MYDSSLDIVSEFKELGLLVSHNLSILQFPRFQSKQNVGFNLAYIKVYLMYLHCVEESRKKLILKSDGNYESRLKELNLVSLEKDAL